MQHSNIDSIISYALPVTWEAPLSVGTNATQTMSYSLPNPFSTHLAIGFTLEKPENVKLQLFDVTGREVRSEEREFDAGAREIILDARDLPAGSYFYLLHGAEWNRSGKLVKLP